ncbi:hypothetical protein FBY03_1388 [Pseudomonas sp. SJZ079]|uniref:hypothetical protein n=1 Tax=Pseudomonas sp. SJZ079 TaxID=2572887 RepID=UPI001198CD48|nr:hypothetical protein [Pseudomonas sp. SJZ079]TWC28276.1 hypothetical protein FBY03_1388 [Pseudomonas sp. SJZ079]
MDLYEIAFAGQLVPGAQLDQVKANLAKLFQADAQRIAMLFSGRRIVIKNNLDAAGAEKYRVTLARAGALIEVLAMPVVVEEVELAPPPAMPVPAQAGVQPSESVPAGRLTVVPRDEYMAAFAEVDAPDFGIAPLGDDLQDDKPEPQAPPLDLSQFSLAPAGSDMGQARAEPDAPGPDISHLKLQE